MNKKISFSEFFSGPGGMSLGFTQACGDLGFDAEHLWAVDTHEAACATYRNNIAKKDSDVICDDVRNIDIDTLSATDIFLFGFPCNDFSIVGTQKGLAGKFGGLYQSGVEVLTKKKPKAFVAENVSGIQSANGKKAFDIILESMRGAGYNVFPHLYKFEEYGIPQTRHRMIIVGIRKDIGVKFDHPKPTFKTVTCKQAIENPPIPENAPNHVLTKQHPNVVGRLKHTRQGENIWQAQKRPDFPDEFKLKDTGAAISQIYKRLDPDKPAYTVTGSGGGGTHVYHWDEPRALTSRERARLQTFPDDFVFHGNNEDVRRQIGMAVPPQGARVVIKALLEQMDGHWPSE